MTSKIYTATLFALLLTSLFSCQKTIHVDLNSTAPQYVVEGNVSDSTGPYYVSITKTINFDQDNTFPGVDGAVVVITDNNTNFADTLSETTSGMYRTNLLAGIPGHTYKLNIKTNGLTFTCSSTMPQPVNMDSLYCQPGTFNKDNSVAVAEYKDPLGTGNYYRLVEYVNDSLSPSIFINSDQISDGREMISTLNRSVSIATGDVVTVTLQCIDQGTYTYFMDLAQTIRQNSATPANPQSNISGGALGYFSAHTSRTKVVIAP